jgi:hypothetical protein
MANPILESSLKLDVYGTKSQATIKTESNPMTKRLTEREGEMK